MKRRYLAIGFVVAALLSPTHLQATEYQPDRQQLYKEIGDVRLELGVFEPNGHTAADRSPAVVFFFGGGWNSGSPRQFYQQARELADLGVVAMTADYRVRKRHGTTPFECVQDGKSAIRWVRTHADELGIDPGKIVAAGGSAGGHVAACTGVIQGHDEPGEDTSVSSTPNAMLLFNPVLDTTKAGYGAKRFAPDRRRELSPCHHVRAGIVPTLVLHGTADTTVPFENAERFVRLMKEAGADGRLEAFPGKGHGYFNSPHMRPKLKDLPTYQRTMDLTIDFLNSLRYLPTSATEVKRADDPQGEAGPRPNIVMILSDDQAWNDYGFMGHEAIETPHLDRLASESLTFTRGYVPSSLCSPSLASIITGLYPRQHRVVGNDPADIDAAGKKLSERDYALRRERLVSCIDRVETLPRRLAERGYRSLQTGKWWLGNFRRGGFTEGMSRGFPEPGGRHGDDGLRIGREGIDEVRTFMASAIANDDPFLVWYAPLMPHTPHNPPEALLAKYLERTDSKPIARYWAMCEWFDQTCGEVLAEIDQQGVRDNTIVVYVTDNGWINRVDRSAYAPRSKRSPYDGGLRTPIMVRWPGQVEPKLDTRTLVSSIDLMPTLLAACGMGVDPDLPGIDLLAEGATASRDQLFGEVFSHDIVDLDRPAESLRHRWTIAGRWKLIAPNPKRLPDARAELYDVVADPFELTNRISEQTEIASRLQADLDAWWSPE